MRLSWHRWWPVLKSLLALAIVLGVGWHFVRVLDAASAIDEAAGTSRIEIIGRWLAEARSSWLMLSAVLYLSALGMFGSFWVLLLRWLGQRPSLTTAGRAYYIGHLGKYVPGKAWALILRTGWVAGDGVRLGVAAMTATYETLTTMAAGALLAGITFALLPPSHDGAVWRAFGLLALAGAPILPAVFNRLVRWATAPFVDPALPSLPPLGTRTLVIGLAIASIGWCLMGTALWTAVQGMRPEVLPWSWGDWLHCTAAMSFAYVAGFLTLPAPGGLGVRELLLQESLASELGPRAVALVLLVRLLWTAAELLMAAAVWCLPQRRRSLAGGLTPSISQP
ncbi:MAG: flippase-like domain-containing protein [Gemmataceae bacterium]|nr:flippase-like domain-containing protein [Gemmataceae bacterium]MDW8263801.1 lysylphosphatidylglycerol synthase domain-containing protein [Gemmataceae bacterium]